MRQGLFISKDNKTIEDREFQFASDRHRLQIALGKDPPHLDIFDMRGTNISAPADGSNSETLATIKHRLGYRPKVFVYFYVYANDRYGVGKYFYGFGAADDYLTYSVDDNNLFIKHQIDDYTGLGSTSTAASTGKIRVKYMICSNPVNNLSNPLRRI